MQSISHWLEAMAIPQPIKLDEPVKFDIQEAPPPPAPVKTEDPKTTTAKDDKSNKDDKPAAQEAASTAAAKPATPAAAEKVAAAGEKVPAAGEKAAVPVSDTTVEGAGAVAALGSVVVSTEAAGDEDAMQTEGSQEASQSQVGLKTTNRQYLHVPAGSTGVRYLR